MTQSNDHSSIGQELREALAELEEADRLLEAATERLIDRAKERGVSERQARADMRRVYTVLRARSLGRPVWRDGRRPLKHVGARQRRTRRQRRTLRARAAAQDGDGSDPDVHVKVLPPLQYLPALPCAIVSRRISPLGEVSPAQWVFSYPHKQKKGPDRCYDGQALKAVFHANGKVLLWLIY